MEGEFDFEVPAAGKPCKTWYKVFGDLKSGKRPLIVVHGSPGLTVFCFKVCAGWKTHLASLHKKKS
jgi:hypothetical protein